MEKNLVQIEGAGFAFWEFPSEEPFIEKLAGPTTVYAYRFRTSEALERFFVANISLFRNYGLSTKAIGKSLLIFLKAAE